MCLKLIGSCEDRKISTAIAEWVNGKKYDKENGKEKVKDTNVSASSEPTVDYASFLSPSRDGRNEA